MEKAKLKAIIHDLENVLESLKSEGNAFVTYFIFFAEKHVLVAN